MLKTHNKLNNRQNLNISLNANCKKFLFCDNRNPIDYLINKDIIIDNFDKK